MKRIMDVVKSDGVLSSLMQDKHNAPIFLLFSCRKLPIIYYDGFVFISSKDTLGSLTF